MTLTRSPTSTPPMQDLKVMESELVRFSYRSILHVEHIVTFDGHGCFMPTLEMRPSRI